MWRQSGQSWLCAASVRAVQEEQVVGGPVVWYAAESLAQVDGEAWRVTGTAGNGKWWER